MKYVLYLSILVVSFVLLFLICVKGKKTEEKYYPLKIIVLDFISTCGYLGGIFYPVGAIACFIYVFSRRPVKNQMFKMLAIALGLCTSVALNYIPNPWHFTF
jgi:hypothetical protein